MKLLVAGGTGFLGGRVVERALAAGLHVVGIARSAESARKLDSIGVEVVRADLEDPATIDGALDATRPDVLVNTASLGMGHVDSLLAAAHRSGVVRALFISTATVYSRFEIAGKKRHIEAERSIVASPLDWTILRPTMIYGGLGDRNMVRLLRLLERTRVVPIPGTGRSQLQPVHVDDLTTAVFEALSSPLAIRKDYDVAGPDPIELRSIVTQAATALDRKVLMVPIPLAPTAYLARIYGRLVQTPRIRVDQVERLAENKTVSITAAEADLGFAPRSFRDGITDEAGQLRRA